MVRDPRDVEDLIGVAESTRYAVRSVTGSLQLDTDADITNARALVAMANKSSRDTARRVARAVKQRAEAGEFHGGPTPFGYEAIKDVVNGRLRVVEFQPHPERAVRVREAVSRLLNGETLHSICVDWNNQGRQTGYGKGAWTRRTLKWAVAAPAVVGQREYNGQLFRAPWPAIVDPNDWDRVCALLSAPERKTSNGNARKYALSGRCSASTLTA